MYDKIAIKRMVKQASHNQACRNRVTALMANATLTTQERAMINLRNSGWSCETIAASVHYCRRNVERIVDKGIDKMVAAQKEDAHETTVL